MQCYMLNKIPLKEKKKKNKFVPSQSSIWTTTVYVWEFVAGCMTRIVGGDGDGDGGIIYKPLLFFVYSSVKS